MKTIVLGVTGSIAAYKAADIVNALVKKSYNVYVVMTDAAKKFITEETMRVLSKNRVYCDVFDDDAFGSSALGNNGERGVTHIELAKNANAIVIAPASATTLAKIAHGFADNMLSAVVLARRRNTPVIIAPAMNTAMYENEITQENIATLQKRGFTFVEPRESLLACGELGKGALAEVEVIVNTIEKIVS